MDFYVLVVKCAAIILLMYTRASSRRPSKVLASQGSRAVGADSVFDQ